MKVIKDEYYTGYGINGSPSDCVKLALKHICKNKPDIVISGINRGPNNACNIYYSGTVGAAVEGALNGVMSFAVSMTGYHYNEYGVSADFMAEFIKKVDKLPKSCLLYNINIPPVRKEDIAGIRFTKMSTYSYLDNYYKGSDPFGKEFFWLSDFRSPEHIDKTTDDGALSENYVSVTPLVIDRTDYDALNKINSFGDKW